MNRLCQGRNVVFAILLAASFAGTVHAGDSHAAKTTPTGVSVHLTAWTPRPFADVALASPELAACFLLSPGWWSTVAKPAALPDETALSNAIGAQLAAVLGRGETPSLTVVVAATQNANPAAIGHADTVLVLQPETTTADAAEMARTVATAVLLAHLRPAPPDPRCDEPLLMTAEAIVDAGSLTLAALPPELRPIRDWLADTDASPALQGFASEVLDPETQWPTRRAQLSRMTQVGGADRRVAAAAALVVEAFGDAAAARATPFDVLLAWKKGSGKRFPPMPRALKRALEKPLTAGLPKAKDLSGRNEVGWDALLRRLQAGAVKVSEVPVSAPLSLRLRAAAEARAVGGEGVCAWLTSTPLPRVRTGCRGEGETGGIVASRPRDGGFEVFWRAPTGDEALLFLWPRWILFPAVDSSSGELWFIDPEGVWKLPLDAHAPPQLAASGSFRHLAIAPDGTAVATVRWPSGSVVVLGSSGARDLAINGRGGVAFVDTDVLVASDGEKFTLASLEGQVRPDVFALPCCRSVVVARGAVTAGVGAPCTPGLVHVSLNERSSTPLVRLADAPLGLVALPTSGYVLGMAEGLWSWPGQGPPERIGAGLTPGPG
jgi:hypothetical protein